MLRFREASPLGTWEVTSFLQGDGVSSLVEGSRITATFAEGGKLSGSAGCNDYTGTYTLGAGELKITDVSATELACEIPAGVMEQEQAFLAALPRTAGYTLEGRSLTLLTEEGRSSRPWTRPDEAPDDEQAARRGGRVEPDGDQAADRERVRERTAERDVRDRLRQRAERDGREHRTGADARDTREVVDDARRDARGQAGGEHGAEAVVGEPVLVAASTRAEQGQQRVGADLAGDEQRDSGGDQGGEQDDRDAGERTEQRTRGGRDQLAGEEREPEHGGDEHEQQRAERARLGDPVPRVGRRHAEERDRGERRGDRQDEQGKTRDGATAVLDAGHRRENPGQDLAGYGSYETFTSVIPDPTTAEWALIVGIVLARLAVPLLIPRFELVIIVALVLDAIDNSLLAAFTDVDLGPDGPYQSVDKALDIYYLAIAYTAMLRNWTSHAAFRIGQFLFYYRLVGVLAFELLDSGRCCSCSRTRSSTSSSSTR